MRTGIELIKAIESGESVTVVERAVVTKYLLDVLKSSSLLIVHLMGLSQDELVRRGAEVAHYIRLRDSIDALGKATHDGDGDND